ncbi:MAG: hypothetical protein UY63_C0014G0009 [Parcubacteria group bacterium GW2011_GWA2_51_10]|nr:MAG: hypothetical protein UY63_C0014G0009 [Parcubacteria group bacterium GW2011_GWA2_51_10]
MAKRVLCVCAGNTCRSPMVMVLAQKAFNDQGIDAVVESCGVIQDLLEGKFTAANEHSMAMVVEEGLDLSTHIPRHVTAVDLQSFDKIVAVTPTIKAKLIEEFGAPADRLVVLNEHEGGVPDPYELGRAAYVKCIATIKRELPSLIAQL